MKKLVACFSILVIALQGAVAQDIMDIKKYREKVVEYNQDIRSAQLGVQAADANIKAAESDKGPRIDAGVKYNYTGRPFDPTNLKPVGAPADEWLPIHHNYNANVTIRQDIYNGGRVKSNVRLQESKKDIQLAVENLTGNELVHYADQHYWQSVGRKEFLALAQEYKVSVEKLVEVAKNKYDAEIVSKNDLLMAQVKLNDADLQVLQAENELKVSIMELNRLMGVDVNIPTAIQDSVKFENFVFNTNDVVERGLTQRGELKQAEAEVRASQALKDLTASKYKGSLHVYAKGLYGAPSPQFGRGAEGNYYAGIGFAMPIYHGGKKKREIAAKTIQTNIAVLQKEKVTDQIVLDISEAQYLLDESTKRVILTENSLSNANENLHLITDRYQDGLAPIIEVINAQINWQAAYVAYINAKVNHMVKRSNLIRATGELYN
ncbi:TolC family protein [Flammeovirga sp. SubArs3]|uniref:TolC family protein n=1 Tax=Flammeovirga sp. SubArs3 TaxID=2995316 RepID=UPI00248D321F|nr:TolC family protein [Flammeovirga sp. SubArs3]